jgi:hypothetical protein
MMLHSLKNIALILAIAIGFWVIPSFGTQGMGSIGRSFSHPDRALIGGPPSEATDRLRRVDLQVETALPN